MSPSSRGGASVGRLADLSPVEAGAVMYLRLWGESDHGREAAARDFALALGEGQGRRAMRTLDQICMLCARHGRRPVMRHGLNCSCLGADENWFAQLVGAASDGAHEDATMLAALLVRPDMAPTLAGLSLQLGLALRKMTASVNAPRATHDMSSAVLH
ncbi:hypothetical protein ACFORG_09995 [Lutimaribacter marinistellae]|uniref:TniQ protein n=1 Tax=Lutimaribacter marinistellae TaxID=1820329 RepID=A0ABV7TGR4_9RHOB